jgi:6-phosphogluconolactonase/glucosamine-6-phosphate isomerase/deaminase
MMTFREFDSESALYEAVISLLVEYFENTYAGPHAVMLTGGNTVRKIYDALSGRVKNLAPNLHVLLSDERHVPVGSPDSNYGFIRNLVQALGIDDSRVVRPRTELPLEECAAIYDRDLRRFMGQGVINLGILGLGGDGHLASLFSKEDVEAGKGCMAQAVKRDEGPDRISVGRDLLLGIEKIVFVVRSSKRAVIEKLREKPEDVVAGMALAGTRDVSVWYC